MRTIWDKIKSLNKTELGILLCLVVVVLAVIVGVLISHREHTNGKKEEKVVELKPTYPDDYKGVGDSDTSEIIVNQESENEEWTSLSDEEYSVGIEIVEGGYSGAYVEDGSDEKVKNVLALKFTNKGEKPIQYAEYVFGIEDETVSFKLTDLPPEESCVVLEMNRHPYDENDFLKLVTRVVAPVDELPNIQGQVLVIDNGDNTLTVMNLTEKELKNIRVYYKRYDEEFECYLGGITYCGTVDKVPSGSSIIVAPDHYESDISVILGSDI